MMNEIGLKIVIVIAGMCVVCFTFSYFMRKLLKVENKKWFSYNHVNELHKKLDWAIRITSTVVIIASTYFKFYDESIEIPWYFDVWFILILLIILSESVRAFMEWKYDTNRKAYILTLSEMVLLMF